MVNTIYIVQQNTIPDLTFTLSVKYKEHFDIYFSIKQLRLMQYDTTAVLYATRFVKIRVIHFINKTFLQSISILFAHRLTKDRDFMCTCKF